ncbi:MAG: imidazolonepropionase [Candidatus Marinimicrobia bacterium]|jgi:imidazolonepropionase|nr:imidazolonepropionase [Candidatus Neomarinimicrobiota bacterium]MBT3945769.1 imidazolonepropionase [Candidatus Neomarinimicrobiota bacterium]MBT4155542.1 imidazolonepropionase [Candidatus Neomarinimicrobiota bacterium]MBT4555235.1 imidazolonepropionase [Candidatus Neomarinimicrobiota bacterium]MBT4752686.1 imidazolonepropionase [Candidatus Neomarinimicrobiota bacterium]|tara:strand:- start:12603 stop:13811 length:1209 start_codon:yes stop_codon:yes gene_type:complete
MNSLKLINIGQLVTYDSVKNEMVVFENTEIAIEGNHIKEVGQNLGDADQIFDCKNKLVTPGFVDPHTHPVFLDGRENEFAMRLQGATYEEIAEAGGGIVNSINGVRNSSESHLISRVKTRMDRFLKLGTTTVECKSGYGLNTESELKSLKVIDDVNKSHFIDMIPTFMGGHAFPPEFKNNPNDYVDLICNEMIPEVAEQGIAEFNDVFCENGYFTVDQSRRILNAGKVHGLTSRIHADEFEDSAAAKLAGECYSISADHLMAVSDEGIQELAENGVIATLLPGTTFFLGKSEYAPYQKLKEAGVDVALATDFNPGSCHIQSMPFILSLSCIYLKMTVLDAIKAATFTSAKSLLLNKTIGSIEIGKKADIIVWDIERLVQIPYLVSDHPIQTIVKSGEIVFTS